MPRLALVSFGLTAASLMRRDAVEAEVVASPLQRVQDPSLLPVLSALLPQASPMQVIKTGATSRLGVVPAPVDAQDLGTVVARLRGGDVDLGLDDDLSFDDLDADASALTSSSALGMGGLDMNDPEMMAEAMKALQDPAVQQQVQEMMKDPAFREKLEAEVQRMATDPEARAALKSSLEMSSDPRIQEYMKQRQEAEEILAAHQKSMQQEPEFQALEEDHKKFLAFVKAKNEAAHAEPEFKALQESSAEFQQLANTKNAELNKDPEFLEIRDRVNAEQKKLQEYAERKNNELKDEPEFAGLREKHLKFQNLLVQKNLELQQDAEFKELHKAEEKFQEYVQKSSAKLSQEPKLLALQESTAKLLADKDLAAKMNQVFAGGRNLQLS